MRLDRRAAVGFCWRLVEVRCVVRLAESRRGFSALCAARVAARLAVGEGRRATRGRGCSSIWEPVIAMRAGYSGVSRLMPPRTSMMACRIMIIPRQASGHEHFFAFNFTYSVSFMV